MADAEQDEKEQLLADASAVYNVCVKLLEPELVCILGNDETQEIKPEKTLDQDFVYLSLMDLQGALMFLLMDSALLDKHKIEHYQEDVVEPEERQRRCTKKVNAALFGLANNRGFMRAEEPNGELHALQHNYKIVLRLCQKLRAVFNLDGMSECYMFRDPALVDPSEMDFYQQLKNQDVKKHGPMDGSWGFAEA